MLTMLEFKKKKYNSEISQDLSLINLKYHLEEDRKKNELFMCDYLALITTVGEFSEFISLGA